MENKDLVNQELLQTMTHYNPKSGKFRWRRGYGQNASHKNKKASEKFGYVGTSGKWIVGMMGVKFLVGHLAWLYVTGEWPKKNIVFKNGDRTDMRFDNLEDKYPGKGKVKKKGNVSPGISFYDGRWHVRKYLGGKRIHVGAFHTVELAEKCLAQFTEKYKERIREEAQAKLRKKVNVSQVEEFDFLE